VGPSKRRKAAPVPRKFVCQTRSRIWPEGRHSKPWPLDWMPVFKGSRRESKPSRGTTRALTKSTSPATQAGRCVDYFAPKKNHISKECSCRWTKSALKFIRWVRRRRKGRSRKWPPQAELQFNRITENERRARDARITRHLGDTPFPAVAKDNVTLGGRREGAVGC